jgi:glycerophosphoryl diester phosphodiesterase
MAGKIYKSNLPTGFDIEGHRGCRGLLPENSIPAFKKALELGVTTLELDLVISKDLQVVVSHEPYFSHEISLTPAKKEISSDKEREFNIFNMDYEEVVQFDTGSKKHPRFPTQEKLKTHKPLYTEVIRFAEDYCKSNSKNPIWYNVEIKSSPEGDQIYHPDPEEFSELVYKVIKDNHVEDRTIIQCFDLRPLQYLNNKYPDIKLSLLVENHLTPEFNTQILGFIPHIYSPDHQLVNESLIRFARSKKMKVIPWTVNTSEEIERLIALGVDGIITDYPNIFE